MQRRYARLKGKIQKLSPFSSRREFIGRSALLVSLDKVFFFILSQLDPMSLAVLNEKQTRAVEYVMEISKKESESVYTQLRDRVVGLGYLERDLEK